MGLILNLLFWREDVMADKKLVQFNQVPDFKRVQVPVGLRISLECFSRTDDFKSLLAEQGLYGAYFTQDDDKYVARAFFDWNFEVFFLELLEELGISLESVEDSTLLTSRLARYVFGDRIISMRTKKRARMEEVLREKKETAKARKAREKTERMIAKGKEAGVTEEQLKIMFS